MPYTLFNRYGSRIPTTQLKQKQKKVQIFQRKTITRLYFRFKNDRYPGRFVAACKTYFIRAQYGVFICSFRRNSLKLTFFPVRKHKPGNK